MKKMEVSATLALPEELEVTEIEMIDEIFTITAHCIRKHPCCPLCGTPAERFHIFETNLRVIEREKNEWTPIAPCART
jgi:hypothetical protein